MQFVYGTIVGLVVGILAGGAGAYLYAGKVIKDFKDAAVKVQAAKKAL